MIGRSDGLGLIRVLRVDRLVLLNEDGNARRSSEQEHEQALERLQRLQLACTPQVFQLIREEPRRFPSEHTAHTTLPPNPPGDTHPHPVEIRLPGVCTRAEAHTTGSARLVAVQPRAG